MFYLSRAEQVLLSVLAAALLAGGGLLIYAKGRNAALTGSETPIYRPAPESNRTVGQVSAVPSNTTATPQAGDHPLVPSAGGEGTAVQPRGITEAGRKTPVAAAPPPSPRPAASPTPAIPRPLPLNLASKEQLETLPGIGPVYAQRILAYRAQRKKENHRGFESKDELLNVPGIGPKRYAAIRDLLTL